MTIDVRFIAWFIVYWTLQLAWRAYQHYRGDRKTPDEWSKVALGEWIVFFFIWFVVLR